MSFSQAVAAMVLIRPATAADIDTLVAMSMRFQEEVFVAHMAATPDTFRMLATALIAGPTSEVFIAERDGVPIGMIATVLYQHPMSQEMVGSEMCWWIDREARGGRAGLRLLRHAEQWAKEHGAALFQMSAPTPEVCVFYERIGYTQIETLFQRRL